MCCIAKLLKVFLNWADQLFHDQNIVSNFILQPSKDLLVLKMSSKCLQHNNFSSSKTSCKYVLKTSWRRLGKQKLLPWRRLVDVLKTCLEDVLKTCRRDAFKKSWRQTKSLLWLSLSGKSKSVSDKSISDISISDRSRRIQNALSSRLKTSLRHPRFVLELSCLDKTFLRCLKNISI